MGHHLIYTNMGDDTYASNQCISYVGRTNPKGAGKGQMINLVGDCLNVGKILHETLHGLGLKLYFQGFFIVIPSSGAAHEHMRWDREVHVKILEQNMLQGAKKNFAVTSTRSVADPYSTFGTPFDYQSVMHYVVLKWQHKGFLFNQSINQSLFWPTATHDFPRTEDFQGSHTTIQIGNTSQKQKTGVTGDLTGTGRLSYTSWVQWC